MFYVQLDANNICIGVSQLAGTVNAPNMVAIPELSTDYIWRKYENGEWSEEKFEPQTTSPLTDYEQTRQRVNLLEAALNELILGEV